MYVKYVKYVIRCLPWYEVLANTHMESDICKCGKYRRNPGTDLRNQWGKLYKFKLVQNKVKATYKQTALR